MRPRIKASTPTTLRCGIYTRVSDDHRLEQEFNSLDNQRESAEAYVKSQAHEGWRCLKECYDDGGFSGGSLDRPALQRLLDAIRLRRIDVVVVYKVDRLTRSLADFAKLVELFDEHRVSFVSVTQAFNTTTSMGRLTLNVLLSFAQFEREVTGERIRDKIAASKKKGIWTGGVVPLGYRVAARALHIVEEHAALVRSIFVRYLETGTVSALQTSLFSDGIVLPKRADGSGRITGGGAFSRGHLYKLLSNPIYTGRLTHKGLIYDGLHPVIVAPELFEAVQAQLSANHHAHRARRQGCQHLLTGRIFDAAGRGMSPTHTQKASRRYRYYTSRALSRDGNDAPTNRVSAPAIEAVVLAGLRSTIRPGEAISDAALIARHLDRISVHANVLTLSLIDAQTPTLAIAWRPPTQTRRRDIIVPPGSDRERVRPMKMEDRARILKAIARARAWTDMLIAGEIADTETIASRETCSERSVRLNLSLAQLSPTIVQAVVDGRMPHGIAVRHLVDLPASWLEQHRQLGL